jgi:hypothetical protein
MDDIMILFHKAMADIASFNPSQFGIFNESEREPLHNLFANEAGCNALKFMAYLSPEQKQRVAIWACERTSYSVNELILALEKFTKYLKSVNYKTYPKTAPQPDKKKKIKK